MSLKYNCLLSHANANFGCDGSYRESATKTKMSKFISHTYRRQAVLEEEVVEWVKENRPNYADLDRCVMLEAAVRRFGRNKRIYRLVNTTLNDLDAHISSELLHGLELRFRKFESHDAQRDTSTKICYNGKQNVPSKVVGNVDRRKPRVWLNKQESGTPGIKLKSNPLPPQKFGPPKGWMSKAEKKLVKELPVVVDDDEEVEGFWARPDVSTPDVYEFAQVWDDDWKVEEKFDKQRQISREVPAIRGSAHRDFRDFLVDKENVGVVTVPYHEQRGKVGYMVLDLDSEAATKVATDQVSEVDEQELKVIQKESVLERKKHECTDECCPCCCPVYQAADFSQFQSGVIQSIEGIVDVVKNFINDMWKNLMGRLVKGMLNHVSSVVRDAIRGTVDTLLKNSKHIAGLASIIYDLMTDERPMSVMLITSYSARLYQLGDLFTSLLKLVKFYVLADNAEDASKLMEEGDESILLGPAHETEGPQEVKQSGYDVLAPVWKWLGKLMPGCDQSTLRKIQMFNALPMAMKNMKNLVYWILEMLPECMSKYFMAPKRMEWYKHCTDPEGAFVSFFKLSEYIVGLKIEGRGVPKEPLEKWRVTYKTILPYRMKPDQCGMTLEQQKQIDRFYKEISPMEATMAMRDVEPIWFFLYGESKIGKSALMPALVANMLGMTRSKAGDALYMYNAETETWDRYDPKTHRVVGIDDLGAVNSPKDPHKDFLQVVNIVSPVPMVLPMASMDDPTIGKKGTYFNSDTLITMSNQLHYDVPEFTHKEALYNRRHEIIQVIKLPDMPVNILSFNHLRFKLMGRGQETANLFCDDNCVHRETVTFAPADVLCPNLRLRHREMNFNQLSRYLKLRREMKLHFSKLYVDCEDTVDSYNDYECTFEGNSELFKAIYARRSGFVDKSQKLGGSEVKPEDRYKNVEVKQNGIDENFFAGFVQATAQAEVDIVTPALKSCAAFITSIGAGLAFTCTMIPPNPSERVKNLTKVLAAFAGLASLFGVVWGSKALINYVSLLKKQPTQRQLHEAVEMMELEVQSFTPEPRARANRTAIVQARRQAGAIGEVRTPQVMIKVIGDHRNAMCVFQNGLVVAGFQLVTTAHLFKREERLGMKEFSLEVLYHRSGVEYQAVGSFKLSDLVYHPQLDLVEINIAKTGCLAFPDWRSHLLRSNEVIPNKFQGTMDSFCKDGSIVSQRGEFQLMRAHVTREGDEEYMTTEGYYGSFSAQMGHCGSPVFEKDSCKIMGLHVATFNNQYARSILFTIEDLVLTPGVIEPKISLEAGTHAWSTNIVGADCVPIGKLSKSEMHHQPTKTDIRPSVIHGKIRAPITEPSVLSMKDPRLQEPISPAYKAAAKYCDPPLELDHRRRKKARDIMSFLLNEFDTGVTPGFLTLEQVLNGDPAIPHCKGVDLRTSMGHGYVNKNGFRGKRGFIQPVDGKYEITDTDLKTNVENLLEQLKTDVVPAIVVDALKDERRKHAKIAAGDTRLFNIFPAHYNIVGSMLLGKFVSHFMALSRTKSPFCVGIDPYSTQWDMKIRSLAEVGVLGFDGDGQKFDAKFMMRQIIMEAAEVVADWILAGTDRTYSRAQIINYCMSTGYVYHLLAGYCFYTSRGTLSGEYKTTPFNSLGMSAHLYIAYCDSVPKEFANVYDFRSHVRFLVFGDDHIVVVSKELRKYYGFQEQRKYHEMLGQVYTPGSKNAVEERRHWPLMSMTFLKNSIRYDGHRYVACLDDDVIWEMTNWITDCDDHKEATIVNMRTAQRYWYFYGVEHFNKCTDMLRSVMPSAPLFTYDDLEAVFEEYKGWETHYSPYGDKLTNVELLNQA